MSSLSILNALAKHTESVPTLFFRNNYSYVIIIFENSLPREEATRVEQSLVKFGIVIFDEYQKNFSSYRVIA